jgi:hypothetical protein
MASRTSSIPAHWRGGYAAAAVKTVAERLQEIVSSGSLRMNVGSLAFPSGQALLDWLKATNQPFNAKVSQGRTDGWSVSMARAPSSSTRKVVGLGFLPEEARHGFLIDIPKGSGSSEMICITEHRGQ